MERRLFHELIHPDEVLDVVSRFFPLAPLGVETVSIDEALGRVLAEDVVAAWDAPPFDRSEVDGYAVVSKSVVGAEEDNPVRLKVTGRVVIGEVPSVEVGVGEAVEIDTGAVLPRGADAVVMVEYTKRSGDYLYVYRAVSTGENVARTGSDIVKGEVVLRKGSVLGPGEIASLAAVGVGEVRVYRRPVVAVLSIGNELVQPGKELGIAQVFDVNSYSIAAALKELGAEVKFLGIYPDSEPFLREAFAKAIASADVVITSGGTSAGVGDLTYRIMDSLGSPGVVVHGLKMKPGKPTVIAVADGKLLIGLPGFPLSALMAFRVVAAPIIAALSGLGPESLAAGRVRARLASRIIGSRGKVVMVPVALIEKGGYLKAFPVRTHSGSVHLLTYIDGFVKIPEEGWVIEEGKEVEVELLRRGWSPAELVVIGSHDYVMEALVGRVAEASAVKLINVGSTRGLQAVGRGEADMGGTHLLHPETNEYNLPYLSSLGVEDSVVLIRGWGREIGFVVPKGNPKGVRSFKDLLRDDILFINRNQGSGTRTYIDIGLRRVAEEEGLSFQEVVDRVRGYWNEVRTHTGVAAAVAQGRADVGVAIKYAADLHGLDFIKLGQEIYDIAVSAVSLTKPPVKALIELLRSGEFGNVLKRFSGYLKLPDTGKVIHHPPTLKNHLENS